jgi:hypothetical protein
MRALPELDFSGAVADAQVTITRAATACTPPPLLTSESEIIPPEAPHDHTQGQQQPVVVENPFGEPGEKALWFPPTSAQFGYEPSDLAADTHHQDYDLNEEVGTRFDDCAPIQLERRGLTSHAAEPATKSAVPSWQREFWASGTIQKNTIAAKLRAHGRADLADGLEGCHSTWTIALCGDCGKHKRFPNRCDCFYCPECQPRLAAERRKAVEWWTRLICQPKHIVLTVRNVPDLTKGHVQELKRWFGRLRRRAFARNWQGGFYSLEVTNEGRGWHLHIHALVDAKWIDAGELARQWNSVTGGIGNIVCVKDARKEGYLAEVTKYAVKGVDLAKWAAPDIITFIEAFTGVRAFGVFGTLYGARTKFAEFIASLKDAKPLCDCGSCNIYYYTESEWLLRDLQPTPTTQPRPPTPTESTPVLLDVPPTLAPIHD